jgi:hypothetical protein
MSLTNEQIQDAIIGHQVDLTFYANGVVREIVGDVNADDNDLFAILLAALLMLAPEDYTTARANTAMAQALAMNERTYGEVYTALAMKLRDVVEAEADFQEKLLTRAKDAEPIPVNQETNYAAMITTTMLGATILETIDALRRDRADTVSKGVHNGYLAGRTQQQIIADIRGTKGAAFTDGAFQLARQKLETVIRTALTHATSFTSQAFYALNDVLTGGAVIWLSVLDTRTTEGCIARAGKRYTADSSHRPIGHSLPWGLGPGQRHFNCRSTFAPLVAGERPTDNSYEKWLRKQSAATQDEVLGKTRGLIYRKNSVPVDKFVNNKNHWITLDELKGRAP